MIEEKRAKRIEEKARREKEREEKRARKEIHRAQQMEGKARAILLFQMVSKKRKEIGNKKLLIENSLRNHVYMEMLIEHFDVFRLKGFEKTTTFNIAHSEDLFTEHVNMIKKEHVKNSFKSKYKILQKSVMKNPFVLLNNIEAQCSSKSQLATKEFSLIRNASCEKCLLEGKVTFGQASRSHLNNSDIKLYTDLDDMPQERGDIPTEYTGGEHETVNQEIKEEPTTDMNSSDDLYPGCDFFADGSGMKTERNLLEQVPKQETGPNNNESDVIPSESSISQSGSWTGHQYFIKTEFGYLVKEEVKTDILLK